MSASSYPRRGRLLVLLTGVLALHVTGCVSVPDSGSVQTPENQEQAEQSDAPFDFTPSGPRRGATPVDIVDGFLLAMQASPVSTAVAREFLTDEASTGWVPERGTLVYDSAVLAESDGSVTTQFEGPVRLDARGSWLGAAGKEGAEYTLDLVQEKGEWRISNPPDALIVPRSHFESRFQQYFLYFFDRSAQILVPEPVYLPGGEQAPTQLVRRLLRGPDESLDGVTRTFIPQGTELELSVPVDRGGTAEVPLSADVLELSKEDLQMALAQIAWTLDQVTGIGSMRITVDGAPLNIPGEGDTQSVQAFTEFDPSIHWASQELFGIRGDRVVALSADGQRRVEGGFATQEYALRSVAVDLPGEQIAGITEDGTSVVVAPRGRGAEADPEETDAITVYSSGADLLEPVWDIHGQIWLVDATRQGARLTVLRSGVPVEVDAPGIAGEEIAAFTVSRDGTRLVAAVRGRGGDRLVVSRVMRSDDGRVQGLTPAADLPAGQSTFEEIRDIGWRTPGSLALLTGPTEDTSRVVLALIDGSSSLGSTGTNAELFDRRAEQVVVSPSPGTPTYIATVKGQLFELAADGSWIGPRIKGGLLSATFVG